MTLGTPKSVIESEKATKVALITPYLTPGRVTVKKVLILLARSEIDASYSRASASESAVSIMMKAWGKV